MRIPALILATLLVLGGCTTTPTEEVPPGYIALPITGRIVPEAQACAIAMAFKLSVTVGTNALSGPALADALRPWGAILDAAYCRARQGEAATVVPTP
jgi:hypothetical protein